MIITYSFLKKTFSGIWSCHIGHALLESSSWCGFTKFLNWFLKQPSCPKNICTEHWRILSNLTAFLEIYLYLKNSDSAKNVRKGFLNALFIYFNLWKFAKFLISFLKAQVSFPSNFASIFNVIKHNSSVLFLAQTLYTLVKGANQRANF